MRTESTRSTSRTRRRPALALAGLLAFVPATAANPTEGGPEEPEEIYAREGPAMKDGPALGPSRDPASRRRADYSISWRNPARISSPRAAWGAWNHEQGFEAYFTDQGIRVVPLAGGAESWELEIRLSGVGREGGALLSAEPARLFPSGRHVRSERGVAVERYENGPEGLETRIELTAPPERAAGGREGLGVVELIVSPGSSVEAGAEFQSVALSPDTEDPGFLLALGEFSDAHGTRLRARMEPAGGGWSPVVRLLFEDRHAAYPVRGGWRLSRSVPLEDRAGEPEEPPLDAAGNVTEPPDVARLRAEWFYQERARPFDRIPPGAYRRAREQHDALEAAGAPLSAASLQSVTGNRWVNIGPAPMGEISGRVSSGRVRAVAYDPSDPTHNTIYIGAATGGVWKTTDGGYHWVPLTDSQPSLAVQTIALDPQDPNIIYAGTGEALPGAGLLRSTDRGARWSVLGSERFDSPTGGAIITRIALIPATVPDPRTQRTILVGTTERLFRSTDSGASWEPVYEFTFSGAGYCDIVVDPRNPSTVYVSRRGSGIYKSTMAGVPGSWVGPLQDANGELPTGGFGRINLWIHDAPSPVLYAAFENTSRGTEFKGLWKSADGGARWTRVTGHPRQFDQGMLAPPSLFESEPNGAFTDADPIALGQVVEGQIQISTDMDVYRLTITGNILTAEIMASRAGTGLDPILKLYDAGGNPVMHAGKPVESNGGMAPASLDERIVMKDWLTLAPGTYYLRVSSGAGGYTGQYQLSVTGADIGCQCWYDQVIAVEPGNPNVMYLGLVRLFRSTDGGVNWTAIDDHGAWNAVHVDIQTAAFEPGNPQAMTWGSDGGVFQTADRGDTWQNLNQDLSITQCYPGLSQHPTDPDLMLVGTQDNGSARFQGGPWMRVMGGDGAYTAIVDNQTWYVSSFGLFIMKTDNGGANIPAKVNNLGRAGVTNVAPFVMSPGDPNVLIAGGGVADPNTPATSHPRVYRTTDGAEIWTSNSQDLGTTAVEGSILSLAFAPSEPATYYAGTVGGVVWRTRNAGGTNWTDVRPPGVAGRAVTDLAVDPLNRDIVYAAVGGFTVIAPGGHLFRSVNGGDTWTDISGPPWSATPLPDAPVNAIVVDPVYRDTLFVGTDYGIYRTTNAGANWETFDLGLPKAAQVLDLVINSTARPGGILRAATYGRGVWELRIGNDECPEADVVGDGAWQGTTRGASADGLSSCGTAGSPDAWYRYTATCDGELSVDTCGSSFDTVVSIHDTVCPGDIANELACNDHCDLAGCGSGGSCARLTVQAGQTYLFRVSGSGGATGEFTLNVSCRVPNDSCDEAIWLYAPSAAVGGTGGAQPDFAPACQGVDDTAPGVWYTVIGTGNLMTASTCAVGTNYDTRLSVYCAGCGGRQCVAANDDACGAQSSVTWCAAPGRVYHVLLHGSGSATGRFALTVSDGASCGPFYPICAPGNDHCDSGVPLGSGDVVGDSTGADTDDSAACAPSSGDVWYEYTPVCHGFATFDTCEASGTLGDTVVSVKESCTGREIACSDDACGVRSRAMLAVTADVPLAIRVAGYGAGPPGTFPLSLDLSTAPLVVAPPGFYVVDGTAGREDHLLRYDPATRIVTDVGPLGTSDLAGLAYASNTGLLYGIDDGLGANRLVTINLQTGQAVPFATTAFDAVRALAYDANRNRLFGVDLQLNMLVGFNPYSGAGRAIGSLGFSGVAGLAYDTATDTLYGSDLITDQLVVIETSTGAATAVGSFGPDFDRIEGLAFDARTGTLYGIQNDVGSTMSLFVRIDTATGAATQIEENVLDVGGDGLEFIPGLPEATVGESYEGSVPVAGGCPSYRFGGYAGLPLGFTADAEGRITGTTDMVGDFMVTFWVNDTDLATPAVNASILLRVRPGNDECADAVAAADGDQEFTTINATTDGPGEPVACDFRAYPQVGSDVWYCYTATCTGTLTASTCGGADYDTKIAVYEGCGCPAAATPAACDDDGCGNRSWVEVPVEAGRPYAVRIGGYREARGSGLLYLACSGDPSGGCCLSGGCSAATASTCLGQGGTYLSDFSSCTPDVDGDGLPDACDGCPDDLLKTAPGACGCGRPDQDADGDGMSDCVDADMDGDAVGNTEDWAPGDRFSCRDTDLDACDDCSVGWDDPLRDGPDADGDGYCILGDCNEADPAVWRTPGEPDSLLFVDDTTLIWEPPLDPGASAPSLLYDVLLCEVPFTFVPAFCLETDDAATTASSPQAPPLGAAFYYLVRAGNTCGEGSLGWRSDGTSRQGRSCP